MLVWIHGGGFVAGCNASPWYRGTRFARDGVVLVSIGYRLGAEGFLPLAGAPHNRAVLDWLAALTWVHENIAGFGGDPSRVTVGGQSAGGTAATTLLAMPQAEGLFRYVLAMSGVAATKPLPELEELAAKIGAHLGVAPTRDAIVALHPNALHDADHAVRPDGLESSMPYRPAVDGEVLTAKPLARIARGAGATVNVLAGCTADEFKHPVAGRMITDTVFRRRVVTLAAAHRGDTFVYEFQWDAPDVGAVHCIDIPFAFDNLDQRDVHPASPPELATTMHRAFVDFVTTGDPGWAPWETQRRNGMVFDTSSAVTEDLYDDLRD